MRAYQGSGEVIHGEEERSIRRTFFTPGFKRDAMRLVDEGGWLALAIGARRAGGVDEIRAGMAQWQAAGARFLAPYQLALLADAEAAAAAATTAAKAPGPPSRTVRSPTA